jgi:hypothetical protein
MILALLTLRRSLGSLLSRTQCHPNLARRITLEFTHHRRPVLALEILTAIPTILVSMIETSEFDSISLQLFIHALYNSIFVVVTIFIALGVLLNEGYCRIGGNCAYEAPKHFGMRGTGTYTQYLIEEVEVFQVD